MSNKYLKPTAGILYGNFTSPKKRSHGNFRKIQY